MRSRLYIALIALTALTACDYSHKKATPAPEPKTTYQTLPAPDPYQAPTPEPYTAPVPEPYPTPVPDPYPAPVPDPYPARVPDAYPTPTPDPYPAPVPEPYPTPVPDPYGSPAPGAVSDAGITLEEGPCFGTCPIYTLTLFPNEFYQLDAGQFTINPGMSAGTLPAGSWAAARAALTTADFNNLPTDVTRNNPAECGTTIATDLPTARISETTIAGTRTVDYYRGCFDAQAKPALDQLVASLRSAMQVTGLVVAP